MSQIFEGEDSSSSDENKFFKTNNEYAKKYDVWRKKEELNKLKTKYGEDVLDEEDSSSSSDDEEGIELTEEIEKDFFRTLSCLKNKDPSIYKNEVNFFKNDSAIQIKKKKENKEKPVFLKDYERNLILEKGGVLSDEEEQEEKERSRSPTYNQEQSQIKESFKKVLGDSDEENSDNWGGIFQQRKKTTDEAKKEESDYKKWLAGQKNKLGDEQVKTDLKPLKDYWNNPGLEDEEKFLRDYLLNKKYLDNEDEDYVPTYEEIVHDSDQDLSNDEENLVKQEEFEHKYNFRYEEPDQEFIKRYPRTMENSLRKTDDKRKIKRQETKERKKKEKEEKMQDIKKMQELKRKEIEEKLEKLKEITGNESLGFDDNDVDGDFDPEEHDRKMQALFNDEFYAEPEDEQKPEFPDLDQELEIENWERYTGQSEDYEPNCEDDNFNMDCDYDPDTNKKGNDDVKGRRKHRKKSKFANAISKPKPKFDPNDKKFEKYFDEYYKLDCEDIVGDIPCRFKYRKVAPNDFGLTTEEILLANERELNKWCSLKKAVQIRSDEVEKYEQIAYKKKGQNMNLKRRILPSLFSETPQEALGVNPDSEREPPSNNIVTIVDKVRENIDLPVVNTNSTENMEIHQNNIKDGENNKSEKKRKRIQTNYVDKIKENIDLPQVNTYSTENIEIHPNIIKNGENNKRKKKKKSIQTNDADKIKENIGLPKVDTNLPDNIEIHQNITIEEENNKTKKKKKSIGTIMEKVNTNLTDNVEIHQSNNKTKKIKKKNTSTSEKSAAVNTQSSVDKKNKKRKSHGIDTKVSGKRKKFNQGKEKKLPISDARLSAYGINPKKYKNKLKYKKLETNI